MRNEEAISYLCGYEAVGYSVNIYFSTYKILSTIWARPPIGEPGFSLQSFAKKAKGFALQSLAQV